MVERKIISDIARAHGGKAIDKDGQESKDTISKLAENSTYSGIPYRSRMIASIVKFADEICEDSSRASLYLLERNKLPEYSALCHLYALSITSCHIDHLGKTIKVEFGIEKKDALKTFKIDEKDRYLLDEIMTRLEKMFLELLYCKRYFYEVIKINIIRATVKVYDEDMEVMAETPFELAEQGYPSKALSLSQMFPSWTGLELAKRIQGDLA